MRNKWPFLRWALVALITLCGSYMVFQLGGFHAAWRLDITKVSFLIMAAFLGASAYCGKLSWKTCEMIEQENEFGLKRAKLKMEHSLFWLKRCESWGYWGTIAGLILVFGAFEMLTSGTMDQAAIKKMFEKLVPGFQTAFITTLVGLTCANILEYMCHNIYMAIEEKELDIQERNGGA